ncbi:hypothetical protein OVS_02195 [Mycoplasma ovis str. Michigan]|uniref:Uncharacterized protein n=1 Tax=Mycoplasma ovis str. Michigan TaxID=1415773 RepID=A0ABM5P1M8_9MOLU|nr:hypothetical protein OVS_02195 [Mycoplasma ovis str. Michigan]
MFLGKEFNCSVNSCIACELKFLVLKKLSKSSEINNSIFWVFSGSLVEVR